MTARRSAKKGPILDLPSRFSPEQMRIVAQLIGEMLIDQAIVSVDTSLTLLNSVSRASNDNEEDRGEGGEGQPARPETSDRAA